MGYTRQNEQADLLDSGAFGVEELREVVFGRSDRLPKALALSLLGRKEYPEEQKVDDLRRVLEDEQQPPRLRHTAAIELGRVGSRRAAEVLERAQEIQDSFVVRGVRRSLGQVRRPEVPREAVSPPRQSMLRVDPERAERIQVGRLDEENASLAARQASETAPGIRLSARSALLLQCGGRNLLYLPNEDLDTPDVPRRLLREEAVVGIVAERHTLEADRWETRYHVLTRPSDSSAAFQILVTTDTGEVVFAGEGRVEGESARFSLATVDHPGGVAIEIQGSSEAGRLQIEQARSELRRKRPKLEPQRQER